MAADNAHTTRHRKAQGRGSVDGIDGQLCLALTPSGFANPVSVRLRYRRWGNPSAPKLLVLGGISADRKLPDWWANQFGPGRPFDPDRYCLIGVDWLSPLDWKAPAGELDTRDQSAALAALLDHLGGPVHAVVGASFGAMVALHLALLRPQCADRLILLSGADGADPQAAALRWLQQEILLLAEQAGDETRGVALARALAMLSYRTPELFRMRFQSLAPAEREQAVARYLLYKGERFAASTPLHRYRALSQALNRHQLDARKVSTPCWLFAVRQDALVPLSDMRALAARLPQLQHLQEIDSDYGHDAFLTETDAVAAFLTLSLKGAHHEQLAS